MSAYNTDRGINSPKNPSNPVLPDVELIDGEVEKYSNNNEEKKQSDGRRDHRARPNRNRSKNPYNQTVGTRSFKFLNSIIANDDDGGGRAEQGDWRNRFPPAFECTCGGTRGARNCKLQLQSRGKIRQYRPSAEQVIVLTSRARMEPRYSPRRAH
ncbi:sulfite oxidase [Anopheles sinensis]|uniref:Sulfite oxidase n=1 Tax=Anopheles sinensis TaxID=74873 RepID=A0A084VZL9_ANOSI|nr:sulfite oxidase [Anopheles sinensis]